MNEGMLRVLAIEPDGIAAIKLNQLLFDSVPPTVSVEFSRCKTIAEACVRVAAGPFDLVLCSVAQGLPFAELWNLREVAPELPVVALIDDAIELDTVTSWPLFATLRRSGLTGEQLSALVRRLGSAPATAAEKPLAPPPDEAASPLHRFVSNTARRSSALLQSLLALGKIKEAAEIMSQSGKHAEAGFLLTQHQHWSEAAQCFRKTGDWRKTVYCLFKAHRENEAFLELARVPELADAAMFLWDQGRFFHAGLILERLKRWKDALSAYMRVPIDDKNFRSSCRRVVALAHATATQTEVARWLRSQMGGKPPDQHNLGLYTSYVKLLLSAGHSAQARALADSLAKRQLLPRERVQEYFERVAAQVKSGADRSHEQAMHEARELSNIDVETPSIIMTGAPILDDGDSMGSFDVLPSLDSDAEGVRLGSRSQIGALMVEDE